MLKQINKDAIGVLDLKMPQNIQRGIPPCSHYKNVVCWRYTSTVVTTL